MVGDFLSVPELLAILHEMINHIRILPEWVVHVDRTSTFLCHIAFDDAIVQALKLFEILQ